MVTCRVPGCSSAIMARSLCAKHYQRFMKHGDPSECIHENPERRFWRLVDIRSDGECWEWKKGRSPLGYGRFFHEKQTHLAHRYAYAMANATEIPVGLLVCHHCDNPPCVNPAHLFLGTPKDNAMDMARKGRGVGPSLPGASNPAALLTMETAREILRRYEAGGCTHQQLADEFGCSQQSVSLIARREHWATRGLEAAS